MQLQDIGLLKKLAIALILVGLVLLIGHELELYLPDWKSEFRSWALLRR